MKKSKLEQVLRRKIRIRITKRKRGPWFQVTIPAVLSPDGQKTIGTLKGKREALTWLYTKLRCMEPAIVTVDCVK